MDLNAKLRTNIDIYIYILKNPCDEIGKHNELKLRRLLTLKVQILSWILLYKVFIAQWQSVIL
jgi:hypothetical protein